MRINQAGNDVRERVFLAEQQIQSWRGVWRVQGTKRSVWLECNEQCRVAGDELGERERARAFTAM